MKTFQPQCNGKVERFKQTILSAIRNYLIDLHHQWYIFKNALNYAYNTKVHLTTMMDPFELFLSRPPPHLELEDKTALEEKYALDTSEYFG